MANCTFLTGLVGRDGDPVKAPCWRRTLSDADCVDATPSPAQEGGGQAARRRLAIFLLWLPSEIRWIGIVLIFFGKSVVAWVLDGYIGTSFMKQGIFRSRHRSGGYKCRPPLRRPALGDRRAHHDLVDGATARTLYRITGQVVEADGARSVLTSSLGASIGFGRHHFPRRLQSAARDIRLHRSTAETPCFALPHAQASPGRSAHAKLLIYWRAGKDSNPRPPDP